MDDDVNSYTRLKSGKGPCPACSLHINVGESSCVHCDYQLTKNDMDVVYVYANNAINHQVANEPVEGKAAIQTMFAEEFANADMVCIVENIFEDGKWAILEWKDPLGLRGCGFFNIENGLIQFQRGYWDKLSFLKAHNLPVLK